MRRFLIISLFVFLNACAINTGVVPLNNNTFNITKQASTGFTAIESVKGDVLQDANRYCANKHQKLKIISTYETKPPYILGNFPKAEMTFTCEAISEK